MHIEVLNGRVLNCGDLKRLRLDLESLGRIEFISDELRAIVVRKWPHLIRKLPSERSKNQC